jgi:Protein of unknown function (DUF982)
MESWKPLCCNDRMYEDYKPFKIVSVLQDRRSTGITSAYDAAKYMLEQWPDDGEPKASTAKAILLKCLEGGCSAAVARVAFVEAARESNIFIETTPSPPPTGKLTRWHKSTPKRRS